MDVLAPPVVAVVVTSDPGPWFEEALGALRAQDYPNLSVLVIDAGSTSDLVPRVAAVLPEAYIHRLEANEGFAKSANAVLGLVEGATHLLLCHDDVAPSPDAVRRLVEEAFRSNAGIVAPKCVEWERPDRLLDVGLLVDKAGVRGGRVERGELDQEQHDAVLDVFAAQGGAVLVRADLFEQLGGFDEAMTLFGEDVDLSWRAQVAGARVIVAPAARVRHLEAARSGKRAVLDRDLLARRHELRAVLKNYSGPHLVRVLPQVVAFDLAEMFASVVTGRTKRARSIAGAWRWNLSRLRDLRRARRRLRSARHLPDHEVRRLQARGSLRVAAALEEALGVLGGARPGGRGRGGARKVGVALGFWTALVLLDAFAVRGLLGVAFPRVGQLAALPSPGTLFGRFVLGTREAGLGPSGPAPFAFALLGLAGGLFGGAMGLVQHLAVLGTLPVGVAGAWRLGRRLGGGKAPSWAPLAAAAGYAAAPLPFVELGQGHWGTLVAYATAPFVLARLVGAARGPGSEGNGRTRALRPPVLEAAGLGLLLVVAGAFSPAAVLAAVVVAVAFVLAAPLAGGASAAARSFRVAVAGVAVAVVASLPWSAVVLRPGRLASTAAPLGVWALARFDPSGGGSVLSYGILAAALLPLLIGRDARLAWAIRLWAAVLACFALGLAQDHGVLGGTFSSPGVPDAFAGAAASGLLALGAGAFAADLPAYRFGWRQVASGLAVAAVVAALFPVFAAALSGRSGLPPYGDEAVLPFAGAKPSGHASRLLWLGRAQTLPLGSWDTSVPGLAYAVSTGAPPDATSLWPRPQPGPISRLARAVELALSGRTTELGHLLAPFGVRYVVVPTAASPSSVAPVPGLGALRQALLVQDDLRELDTVPSVLVLENTAPLRPVASPPPSPSPLEDAGLATGLACLGACIGALAVKRRSRRRSALAIGASEVPAAGELEPPAALGTGKNEAAAAFLR